MSAYSHAAVADNTPILVGAGQTVHRLEPRSKPPFHSPMQLAASACEAALTDADIAPIEIDTLAAIRLFSDSVQAWKSPFGGSNNPPESISRRIGANPVRRLYSDAGGTEPMRLMAELLQAIAQGETRCALLTGAESIASTRFALRNGFEQNWTEEFDTPFENRHHQQRFVSQQEIDCGLTMPVRSYATIENLQAHQMQHSLRQHQQYMGNLMAPFSAVAAKNAFSRCLSTYSAQQLAQPSADNYAISLPYLKRLVAQDAVNQAAALVLTSVGNARRLGVSPDKWVYVESYAEGVDQYLSQRVDPARSEAMARVLNAVMHRANAQPADLDLIDIYSCFPCAVHAASDLLHLPIDNTIPLTVTGGLPFFGGPGNNYTTHALAEMVARLRGRPSRALVTANGGILSKHAAAILTTDAHRAVNMDWSRGDSNSIDCSDIPTRPYADGTQSGVIMTYTVVARKDKPDIAMILGETASKARFLASSTAADINAWITNNNPIGRAVQVRPYEDRNTFSFV